MKKENVFTIIACSVILLSSAFLSDQMYKKGYSTGLEEGLKVGGLECIGLLGQAAKRAAKDTTEVACLDFYVNKDTFHVPMWSRAIKMKPKDLNQKFKK